MVRVSMRWAVCLLLSFLSSVALAAGDEAAVKAIRAALVKALPGLQITDIKPAGQSGLYEVDSNNSDMIYATADGTHFVVGQLYSVVAKGLVNLTEQTQARQRVALLKAVPADEMITYAPKGKPKAVIDVFTDLDCPYCRLLHREVPQLNAMGIQVNYLAYPRTGPNTPSFEKYVSVWCSKDRKAAFTAAKEGQPLPRKTCDNPVRKQYDLGNRIGVDATPTIVLQDGEIVRGYLPAKELAKGLGVL